MAEQDEKIEIVKLLTEDIQSHRDYIQRLYRNAVIIGGSALLLIVAFGTWFLGDRYDESLLRTVVNKELREEVDRLRKEQTEIVKVHIAKVQAKIVLDAQEKIAEAGELAKNNAVTELDSFANEQLFEAVRRSIGNQLQDLQKSTIEELTASVAFPSGLVAAFDDASGCPLGWIDIGSSLRGRTIVGAVRNSDDVFGFGKTGGSETHTLSAAEMPAHSHTVVWGGTNMAISGVSAGSTFGVRNTNGPEETRVTGSSQPHNNMPPYIALYLCKKE